MIHNGPGIIKTDKLIYQISYTIVKGLILFFNSQDPQESPCLKSEMMNMEDDPHLLCLIPFLIILIILIFTFRTSVAVYSKING